MGRLTVNPFVSEAQERACYAKKAAGEAGSWDCGEWSRATKGKKLPKRKGKPTRNSGPRLVRVYGAGRVSHVLVPAGFSGELARNFDENQPRDDHGRWADDGGPSPPEHQELPVSTKTEPRASARAKEVAARAAKIQISKESHGGGEIGRRDYDEIEDTMSDQEKEEMEESLQELRDRYVEDELDNYSSDYDPDEDITDEERAEMTEAQLAERRQELEDEHRDSVRENIEDGYSDREARREYLAQFYDDHEGETRFSPNLEDRVWGLARGNEWSYRFTTKAGDEYTVTAEPQRFGGRTWMEVQFSDEAGAFKVTGAGNAHEVFSEVSAAVTALVTKQKLEAISFSAYEPSRQKLYDRLVRTVSAAAPDYSAVAIGGAGNTGSAKQYAVVLRHQMPAVRQALEEATGKKPEVLVNRSFLVVLKPLALNSWFTPRGWLTSNADGEGDNCGTGAGGFQPGNTCGARETSHGSEKERYLHRLVDAHASRRDWKLLPSSFKDDAIKKAKDDIRPHFRGRSNNEIKARGMLSKASDFQQLHDAITQLTNNAAVRIGPLADTIHEQMDEVTKKDARETARIIKYATERGVTDYEKVGREIAKRTDYGGEDRARARTVGVTEMTRAYAEGFLADLPEDATVVFVAGDENTCQECLDLDGEEYTVAEAQGVIPVHPNCTCHWELSEGGGAWDDDAVENAEGDNCGTGAGGFQPGNTCASEGRGHGLDLKPTNDGVNGSGAIDEHTHLSYLSINKHNKVTPDEVNLDHEMAEILRRNPGAVIDARD